MTEPAVYVTIRRLYRRLHDPATAPNERDACQMHIDRLLLRHGLTLATIIPDETAPASVRMKRRKNGIPDQGVDEVARKRASKIHTRDARKLDNGQLFDIIRYHNAGWTISEIEHKVPATRQWIGRFLRDLGFTIKRGRRVG